MFIMPIIDALGYHKNITKNIHIWYTKETPKAVHNLKEICTVTSQQNQSTPCLKKNCANLFFTPCLSNMNRFQ